jgi:effector-binding domain-containing protein
MGAGHEELMRTVRAQQIEVTGPWFTHHLRLDQDVFDFHLSVPVATAVKRQGRVQPGEWPAMTVARAIYRGPYQGLGEAWEEFDEKVEAQGHRPMPDLREVYLVGPWTKTDPADFETELNRQILR